MSTFQDKRNKRWRYSFMWQGKRYNGSCPKQANNERNAERLERLRQEELVAGKKRAAITVNVLADKFFAYQSGRVAQLTMESQRNHIDRHVRPIIGKRRVDEIDKDALDTLSTRWLEDAEPTTVNTRMGTLLRMLALAAEWGHIPNVPKYTPVKVPDETPRFLTEDEAQRLLDAAAKPRIDAMGRTRAGQTNWWSMILVALRTGLRVGELRGLQWGDVNLAAAMLQVRRTDPGRPDFEANAPKGKRERTVPLSPDALIALRDLKPENAKARDWVWPALAYKDDAAPKNRSRSQSGCKNAINAAVLAAGIDNPDEVGWHTLRHTFASWLAIRGVSLRIIQDLLGHASISQTEVYAHLMPNAMHHSEVAKLDLAIAASAQPLLTGGDE